jgi:hypothetical protein
MAEVAGRTRGKGTTEYGLKPIPVLNQTTGDIEYYQPKKSGGADKMVFGKDKVMLDPDLTYTKAGGKIIAKDMFGRVVSEETVTPKITETPAYQATVAEAVEEAKVKGGGKISPIEKKTKSQKQATQTVKDLKNLYTKLDEIGGIVNTEKSSLSNMFSRIASSNIGQSAGKFFGTKAQSLRNQIESTRPTLLGFIRNASNMGAKGMDSEKEMEFYLKTATDPTLDLQFNMYALKQLDKAYGLNLGLDDVVLPEGADAKVKGMWEAEKEKSSPDYVPTEEELQNMSLEELIEFNKRNQQ